MASDEDIPERSVVFELQSRTIVDWSLEQSKQAMRLAESGDYRLAADLCESLMTEDGRIRGPLSQRTSILGLQPIFEAEAGSKAETFAKLLSPEGGKIHDELFGAEEFEKIHRWGLVLGFCPYRLQWWDGGKPRRRSGINVPAIEFWHPRNSRFDWSLREWKLTLDGGSEVTLVPGGSEWGIYLPYGEKRPHAEALWRALWLLWVCGMLSMQDWSRLNEKLGIGAFVATAPVGGEGRLKEIARQLKSLGREKAFSLPAGWVLDLIESNGGTVEGFARLQEVVDAAKAITILGANLTTEVKGGSLAASKTHEGVSDDIKVRDERIIRTQKSKILRPVAAVNFGDPEAAPVVGLDITPPEDDSARVATWKTLGEATEALLRVGYLPDLNSAAALVKLPQTGKAVAKVPTAEPKAPMQAGRAGSAIALATAKTSAGTAFGRGRDYIDQLELNCCAVAAKKLAPTVASIIAAIDDAEDYEDALARVTGAYRGAATPSALVKATEAALILAELAGAETVDQELELEE